jgi:hypothetical protein
MAEKAVIASVDFGYTKIEGLMLPDGSYRMGVSQIAVLLQFNTSQASRYIRNLLGNDRQLVKIESDLNNKPINTVTLEQFEEIVHKATLKGNTQAIELWNQKNPTLTIQKKKRDIKKKTGYVYLLEGVDVLKVGFSTNIKNRIKTLQRWGGELSLLMQIKGDIPLERRLHSELHKTGKYFGDEWYPLSRRKEIIDLMAVQHFKCNRDNMTTDQQEMITDFERTVKRFALKYDHATPMELIDKALETF